MLVLTIFILFIEALFFYIPLKEIKEIKTKRNKLKLYLGIFLANIISTLIFNNSIFRYILYPVLIFTTLKIINKKSKIYDFFIISFLMAFKFIIEFLIVIFFYNNLAKYYVIFVIIMQFSCIFIINLIKNRLRYIYKRIKYYWNYNKKFYIRYFALITFNSFILFLIYNLIKMSEVS